MKEFIKLHLIENRFTDSFKCPKCKESINNGDTVLEVVESDDPPTIEWYCKNCASLFLHCINKRD